MRSVSRANRYVCLVLLGLPILIAPMDSSAQAAPAGATGTVFVTDGTPLHLILMDDLQGKKLQAKQIVHFRVREDLAINSVLIVKTGAEAFGHIESVSKSGLFGKSGRLVLQFDYVMSVSGAKISLKGNAGVTGGKGGALTWESAMWYGPDASLAVGTIINAYVNQDQSVPIR